MTDTQPIYQLQTPLTDEAAAPLRAGDKVLLSGWIYTARDAAHKRMTEALQAGDPPLFSFEGQAVYYAGPCPAPPGHVIGSIGPTTSGRVDAYAPYLIQRGLKYMIGKGLRNAAVIQAIRAHKGLYFAAVGGAGALLAGRVRQAELVGYEDLGTEAVRRLYVEDFPLIVAIDTLGNSVYDR